MATTTTTGRSTVVGVFHELEQARMAIEALKEHGFNPDSISILSPRKEDTQALAEDTGTHAGSGAATGAVTGGILGGLGGWLVGIGAIAIPGIGPIIAAGAIATAIAGAAIGASVGAIAGALIGMGVPEDEAKYYENEVKSGRTLVTVGAAGRYDEARQLLRQNGAYDIESGGATTGTAAAQPVQAATRPVQAAAGQQTVQLREEQLQARKQTVEAGSVQVHKEVVSEERTLEVPVTHEEVVVDRRAVERRPSDTPIGDAAEQTLEVPVYEERVTLEKQPVVTEEVTVGTRQVQETQPVSGTVRREELRVEPEGDARIGGATTETWQQAMPRYRSAWQQQAGASGGRWDDVAPAYQYGWEMHNRPDYRGRSWVESEPQLRQSWTAEHPTTPWDTVRDSIRNTWDNATH